MKNNKLINFIDSIDGDNVKKDKYDIFKELIIKYLLEQISKDEE